MTTLIIDGDSWNSRVETNGSPYDIPRKKVFEELRNPFPDDISLLITDSVGAVLFSMRFLESGKLEGLSVSMSTMLSGTYFVADLSDLILNEKGADWGEIEVIKDTSQWTKENLSIAMDSLPDRSEFAFLILYILNHSGGFFTPAIRQHKKRLMKQVDTLKKDDEYYILDVNEQKNRKKGQGSNSTDIKQRYHLRRGHYKTQHSKDKIETIWIKPYFAGDKSQGIISKDYAI